MGFWSHDPTGTVLEGYYRFMRDDNELDYPQAFVDIITPNAGGERMARGAYEALCKHGQSINWRLFPISQGEHGAHDFWIKTASHDDRVFPILNDWNKPVPHAYNQGYMYTMRFSNPAPFIFTMDDDTRLAKDDWLQYLLWLRSTYPNPDEIAITTYGSSAIGRTPPPGEFWFENDIGWDSNLLYRPVLDRVGLADENLCWHWGDSSLCRRMTIHHGYKILLGKQPNKWRFHIGRVGSSQLGKKEEWWRAMSIQLGGIVWSNMAIKGVGPNLVVDRVLTTSDTYPKEGYWDASGTTFHTYNHSCPLDKSQKFPFFIDEHAEESSTDMEHDVNLMAYKVFRKANPQFAPKFDKDISDLYGGLHVPSFLETVADFA